MKPDENDPPNAEPERSAEEEKRSGTGHGPSSVAEQRRVVPETADGQRLDVFLSSQPEIGSRSRAKHLLQTGCVRIDASPRLKAGTPLRKGWTVVFVPDFGAEIDEGTPLPLPSIPVLYEDAHVVVIDKPPTVVVHGPAGGPRPGRPVEPTVASWFVAHYGSGGLEEPLPSPPEFDRPGIVHRLDRETSGVMVLARTSHAMEGLRAQFRERTVHKEYRALTYGEPRFESDWIEKPLMPNPRQPDRMVVAKDGGGKPAATFYEVAERFDGFTWFACRPKTGRTHQIRVHMTSIGHSLVGDRAYRSRNRQQDALPEGAPDPGRHCLHAFRLEFCHPRTGEDMRFEAPVAADITPLLDWLRAHRPSK